MFANPCGRILHSQYLTVETLYNSHLGEKSGHCIEMTVVEAETIVNVPSRLILMRV